MIAYMILISSTPLELHNALIYSHKGWYWLDYSLGESVRAGGEHGCESLSWEGDKGGT